MPLSFDTVPDRLAIVPCPYIFLNVENGLESRVAHLLDYGRNLARDQRCQCCVYELIVEVNVRDGVRLDGRLDGVQTHGLLLQGGKSDVKKPAAIPSMAFSQVAFDHYKSIPHEWLRVSARIAHRNPSLRAVEPVG
jgi:hypothetical protein